MEKKMAPFTLDCRIIRLFALFKSFLVNTRVCTVYVRCVWMMVYTCIRLCTIYAMIWGRARRVGWLDRRDIGGAGGTIHHTAETSRHIAGSDVMLEISTNNLYADVSARSRFAGLPIHNNKLTPLRDCGYTCATRTRADMSYWRLVPFFVNLI